MKIKKRQNLLLTGNEAKNVQPTKVRIPVIISTVASHLKENRAPSRTIAKS